MNNPAARELIESAANRYAGVPRRFARNKLRFDPAFTALLERGWLPDGGTLLDLGCGQGFLLAMLASARERFARGEWPADRPSPPRPLSLYGIEVDAGRAAVARRALGVDASVTAGDIRHAAFPLCAAVVVLDVLLYLNDGEQREVIGKIAAALQPGGVLVLREADAGAGPGFHVTRWAERALEIARGRLRARLHYRTARQWTVLLEAAGFAVESHPMSAGTPFANVLYVCKKRQGNDRELP